MFSMKPVCHSEPACPAVPQCGCTMWTLQSVFLQLPHRPASGWVWPVAGIRGRWVVVGRWEKDIWLPSQWQNLLWISLLADTLAPGLGSHPTSSVVSPGQGWLELPAVTDLRIMSPVPLSSHFVSSPPCIQFPLLKEVSVRPRQT